MKKQITRVKLSNLSHVLRFTLLIGIVIFAVVLRMYRVDNPIADWHSFRQADTASVTREFIKHSYSIFEPRYHDLSNIQSGEDNLLGYRMVEFPVINYVHAGLIQTFFTLDQQVLVERVMYISYSIGLLLVIFWIGLNIHGYWAGVLAAVMFAVLPYSVFYSRSILPDMPATFFGTLGLASILQMTTSKKFKIGWILLSAVSLSLGLLIKPFVIFLLPVYGYILFRGVWLKRVTQTELLVSIVFLGLSSIPMLLWRDWIQQFPAGIPASDWLYNKNNIRFSGAFFNWIFKDRVAELILGIYLVPFLVYAVSTVRTHGMLLLVWGVSIIGYLWIFAGGNVQHDYYQIILIPFLVLSVAVGATRFIQDSSGVLEKFLRVTVFAACLTLSLAFSWYRVRGYFNVNHWEIVRAGQAVDAVVPENAKVIAPYMGDTAFLFQTNRTGWPIGGEIEEKVKLGATHYVSVNYDDETRQVMDRYTVLQEEESFVIVKLESKE